MPRRARDDSTLFITHARAKRQATERGAAIGLGEAVSRLGGLLRRKSRDDAAVRPERKKPITAGRTTVGAEAEQAFRPAEQTLGDFIAGDALQVEVAALPAVRVRGVADWNRPREEATLTGAATPRPQPGQSQRIIPQTMPFRATAMLTLAGRTDQARPLGKPTAAKEYATERAGCKSGA